LRSSQYHEGESEWALARSQSVPKPHREGTLEEIRQLFFGFRRVTRASERWQKLSQRKLAELDALMFDIKTVRRLLKKMMRHWTHWINAARQYFGAGAGMSQGNLLRHGE
jgi:hypothetical protein